jgi:hypothetical protein
VAADAVFHPKNEYPVRLKVFDALNVILLLQVIVVDVFVPVPPFLLYANMYVLFAHCT